MMRLLRASGLVSLCMVAGCSLVADFDRSKIDKAVRDAGLDAAGIDAATLDAAGIDAAPFLKDAEPDDATLDAGVDAATDADTDAGMDAAMDAAMDAGTDAGEDAAVDAGTDAEVDAGEDAAVDAGADSGQDAGQDSGVDAGPPECSLAPDCGSNGACFVRTCTLGDCGVLNLSNGASALTGQTGGNCKRLVCDGSGGFSEVNDNTDVPNDGKQCTADSCSNGSPVHTATPGNSCTQSGGSVCNSAGNCVQCTEPSHCGDDTNCVTFSCTGAFTCQQTNTSAGTVTTTDPVQVAGDCKEIRCNGSGGTTQADDDGDLPNDSQQCTVDTCNSGTPTFTPTPGDDCTQNGGSTCNAAGQCVGCVDDIDCGMDTDCVTHNCNMGVCEFDYAPMGTPTTTTPAQTAGDCTEVQCDGSGGTMPAADDGDLPNDNKECTLDTCDMGDEVFTPKTVGDACTQDGGDYCDVSGDCVECINAGDCGDSDDCVTFTCSMAGECGQTNTPMGTATTSDPAQVAGDCQQIQCNGSGGTMTVDFNTDLPANDNNVCTDEVCNAGNPEHPNSDPDTACDDGGSGTVCDGDGNCVACLGDMDCTSNICVDEVCYTGDDLFDADASGSNNVAGEVNELTFGVITATPWPADGILTITFGAGFDVSGATLSSTMDIDGTLMLAVNGQDIVLTRSGGTTKQPSGFQVVLDGIVNPGVSGTSAAFAVATRTAAGVIIDSGNAPGLSIAPGALTGASVVLSNTTVSGTGTATVTFTLQNDWPADGRIHIELPPELDATSVTLQSVTGPMGTFTLSAVGQSMQITHDTGATVTSGGATIEVVLANVGNPTMAVTTTAYFIYAMESDLDVIDQANVPGTEITN